MRMYGEKVEENPSKASEYRLKSVLRTSLLFSIPSTFMQISRLIYRMEWTIIIITNKVAKEIILVYVKVYKKG